jgi:hypothetical protein
VSQPLKSPVQEGRWSRSMWGRTASQKALCESECYMAEGCNNRTEVFNVSLKLAPKSRLR